MHVECIKNPAFFSKFLKIHVRNKLLALCCIKTNKILIFLFQSMNRKSLVNAFSPIHSPRIAKVPQDFDQKTQKATDHRPSSPPTPPHSLPREYLDDDYGQEGPTENYEYPQHDPMQFLDDYDVHSDG